MMKRYFVVGYVLVFLFPALSWGADKIQGNACYTYGDNESLVQAEQMTKTLAIRNAIESYSIFIQSTTQVTDLQLSSDLINTISTGQVKRIKILKRLQSGRKLCYTVVGYVEPNDLRTAIKEYLSGKHRIATGRVKENEWIKIVDNFVQEVTPDSPLAKSSKGKVFKDLYVEIEFLKPCTATTLFPEISEKWQREVDENMRRYDRNPKSKPFMSPRSQAFFMIQLINLTAKKGEDIKGALKEYRVFCEENGIDPYEFKNDLYLPQFRCDNRIKVFVIFLSKGTEIETVGQKPFAYLINDKSTERKTEMVSGERTYVSFLIPEGAESWEVWVPK